MASKKRRSKEVQKKKSRIKNKIGGKKKSSLKYIPESHKKLLWIIPLTLAAICLLVFYPALENDFTNWDDELYVVNNYLIRDLSIDGIKAIFSEYVVSNYHPVTILSLAFNFTLSELNAALGYVK